MVSAFIVNTTIWVIVWTVPSRQCLVIHFLKQELAMRKFIFDSMKIVNDYHNSLHKIWELANDFSKNEKLIYSDIVKEVRNTIDLRKSPDDSDGHTTLLLLEQHTDRLVAMETTAPKLHCDSINRDINNRPFYQLHRAEQSDDLDKSILNKRGLTGWVFVENQCILSNDIKSYSANENTENLAACDVPPYQAVWGHTVSEFPVLLEKIDWNAHYIASPIRISELPVGVLRYTCTMRKNKFAQDDLNYLSASSEIISIALQNRSYLQNRDAKLRLDSVSSGDNYNTSIDNFLNILQNAFNTSIVTIYLYDEQQNKLVMSYEKGIRLSREEMANIYYDGKSKKGITWQIYKDNNPIFSDNIKTHKQWKGAFQEKYYHNAPRWAEVINIPFIGGPINNEKNDPIGVIKLELPTVSSGLSTFTREDFEFFIKEVLPITSRLFQNIR